MTIGFNVVLALFILAPGFGAAMALWAAQRHKTFIPAAPATTSTITLAVVALGALLAHFVGAVFFGLIAELAYGICSWWGFCLGSGQANPYLVLIHAGDGEHDLTSWEVMWTLGSLIVTTFATMKVTEHEVQKGTFAPLLYGWMAGILKKAEPEGRYVLAYVLTDIEKGGDHLVGYQGLLEDMNLGTDKEIVSVTLTEAEPFYVKLGDEKLERIYAEKESPFPYLHFTKGEFKNIAFEVQEYEADDGEAEDSE